MRGEKEVYIVGTIFLGDFMFNSGDVFDTLEEAKTKLATLRHIKEKYRILKVDNLQMLKEKDEK